MSDSILKSSWQQGMKTGGEGADRDRGREGRTRGKIRVSETANTNQNQMGKSEGGATVERN